MEQVKGKNVEGAAIGEIARSIVVQPPMEI